MTKHTPTEQRHCEKIIYGGNASWRGSRCSKKAKVEEGGKWYCGTHSAEAEAKRRQRRNERWEAREAQWKARRIKEQYEKACIAAFHSPEGREIPTEKITEGLVWEMRDALELILPMAKGYATRHQVGSNAEYVETARALLAKLED